MTFLNDTDRDRCNIYEKYRKKPSTFFGIKSISGYDGIPQNFIINVIGWTIFIVIFSILRKKAWNYGRIALFERNETIYVQTNVITINETDNESDNASTGSGANEGESEGEGNVTETEDPEVSAEQTQSPREPLHAPTPNGNGIPLSNTPYETVIPDQGLFSWIKTVLTLTDEQYLEKSGIDCVQYLSFQRHLIFLATIIAFFALVIVLPINFQGKEISERDGAADFLQTSILNVKPDSNVLWVHVILALSFFFLGISVMRHFHSSLKGDKNTGIYSSVMITGLPRNTCHEDMLRQHFMEVYPDIQIQEINFAYDISYLKEMEFYRQAAASAKKYWLNYYREKNKRPMMRPFICGTMCFCCGTCGCKETDAIDFYTNQELLYTKEEKAERKKALTKPLGIVFLTLETPEMAARIMKDYRFLPKYLRMTPASTLTSALSSRNWSVDYAPLPADLYWENLALSPILWYIKIIIINVILLVAVTFYTTPVFFLNNLNLSPIFDQLNNLTVYNNNRNDSTSVILSLLVDTLPTVLLWLCAVTLPSLVSVSDRIVQFWTKTAENRSKMIKIYSYLIFMVLIFPSFGLTSFTVLLNNANPEALTANFHCIFKRENGALFVNYLCTSTFLGTASELLRIPELLVYVIKICLSRSPAENAAIRQSALWEFQLGSQYAWMMLNFTIFTVFSLIFPVIAPFGLIYIILKHYVDRYNIYFAYGRTKVAKEVHETAVNFTIVCMFLLVPTLVAYVTLTPIGDEVDTISIKGLHVFCIVSFCFISAVFIGQLFFNMVMGSTLKPYNVFLKERAMQRRSIPQELVAEMGISSCDSILVANHERTQIVMGRYFPRILRPEKANHDFVPGMPVLVTALEHENSDGEDISEPVTTEVTVEITTPSKRLAT